MADTDSGSSLDLDSILARLGMGPANGGRDAALGSDFSVPTAGTTPAPADAERPTIGARMAGDAPKPQPAPAPADAPAQPTFQFDPSKMPDALRPPALTPNQIPKPPVGANNPNLTALAKEQADYGKPLDKSDPKYKMGIGQRILGTFANAANGFARNGQPVVDVGPGATNWKFGRDEATREANLGNVNTQIGTQEKLDTENEKMFQDATRQAYDTQLGAARQETAGAQNENATTRAALESSQAEKNAAQAELARTKAGQEPEPKTEAEIAVALQTAQQKGDKQGVAKYKGALAELAKQKAAGKDTTAGDIARAISVAKFRSDEHDKVNKEQEAERARRYAELDKGNIFDPQKLDAAKQKIDADLETKYAARHTKADSDADQMLSLTKSGASLKSGNAPGPKTPPKVGDTIMVDKKPFKVTGINPKTKKPIGNYVAGN